MKRLKVLLLISLVSLILAGCSESTNNDSNKRSDEFKPLYVENEDDMLKEADNNLDTEENTSENYEQTLQNNEENIVNTNDESNENVENTDTENTDTNEKDQIYNVSEEEIKYYTPDIGKYTPIIKESDSTFILSESLDSVYDALNIGDTLEHSRVSDIINQISLDTGSVNYNFIAEDIIDDNTIVYIITLDYDYYLVIYSLDTNSAVGYHDPTGYLASIYSNEEDGLEEELEYQRQLEEGLISDE